MLKPTFGKFHFADGEYEGDLLGGIPNGKGRTRMTNGDLYIGDYVNGKKNGHGIYKWENGDLYEGEHLDGKEHGKGNYKYADGDRYQGDFKNGMRDGFGFLTLEDGSIQIGHFHEGQYHGRFYIISALEDIVTIGNWLTNQQHGTWKDYEFMSSQVYSDGQLIA